MASTDLKSRRKRGGNFIKGAVKHPGLETKMAKEAGEGVQEYAQEHKSDKGKSGQRARFAIRMKAIARSKK